MDEDKVERLRERLLQCPVCMDEYRDPRLLPCHHTMCSECINNLLVNSPSGRFFRCPQCRRDVCVPRAGIAELPVNFFVRSLQDELGMEEDAAGPCQVCHRGSIVSQFHCMDCDLDICRFCIHEHRLIQHKDSNKVSILRMEAHNGVGPMSGASNRKCKFHAEEVVQLFCETCHQPVCVSCSCGEHKKHIVLPLAKKLHSAQNDLQQTLEQLTKERRRVRFSMRQLDGAEIEARDNTQRTLHQIEYRVKELHRLVNTMAEAVVEKVKHEEHMQLTALASRRERLRGLDQRLDIGINFLRGLQEGDVCLELFDAFKSFSAEIDNLRKSSLSSGAVPLCDHRFLLGHHRSFNGYMAATFGTLVTHHTFLCIGGTRAPWKWRLRRTIGVKKILTVVSFLAMVYTILVLLCLCVHNPVDAESVIGLIFVSIITVAACLVYFKT